MKAGELADLIAAHRVIVCVGSGGVGKTTTSAALALRAAVQGRRVLCLTIDPARRLAQSLGLQELSSSEQVVPPELFEAQGLECKGELSAMMLDMKHTFDDLVTRHASSPGQRERILNNRLYQYVSTSLAGTQEYMAMEKLHAVRRDPRFDLIVLDTPPTTNALDFLDAPQKLVGAIDSPVMRWFVETLEGSQSLSLFGRGTALVLKGLSKFTGAEFLDNVGQFVSEINVLFGGFRERAKAVYDDLKGNDVAFVVVTSPLPATIEEALYFAGKLQDYGITPKGVVVNRVHTLHDTHVDTAAATDALRLLLLETNTQQHDSADRASMQNPTAPDVGDLLPRMQRALQDEAVLAQRDQVGVQTLRKSLRAGTAYAEVPAFDRDVQELGALYRVSEYLAQPAVAGDAQPG